MPADYDVVTFDCYGTLIDWDGGIRLALAAAARHDQVLVDLDAALAAYHASEPALQIAEYQPYREVLALTARRAATLVDWVMSDAAAEAFAESLPDWQPFADTNPALERLAQAGYRLGILSNVDDDLLEGTRRHLSVPFDLIVTAQQVGSYKPEEGHFLRARERLGGLRWLHAAQSHFHDVAPCGRLGVPVVWVNRKHEQIPEGGAVPLAQVVDLAGLADFLGA
jgi:2-haloalkanoic acid dehalogenase type II